MLRSFFHAGFFVSVFLINLPHDDRAFRVKPMKVPCITRIFRAEEPI